MLHTKILTVDGSCYSAVKMDEQDLFLLPTWLTVSRISTWIPLRSFWLKNTKHKSFLHPSTLEAVRWCSSASGRRNEQSCWTEHSSPPRTLAAERQKPLTGAGRAGEAVRPRRRATETRTYEMIVSPSQKGRKRIQRRCEACSHTHKHSQPSKNWGLVKHNYGL